MRLSVCAPANAGEGQRMLAVDTQPQPQSVRHAQRPCASIVKRPDLPGSYRTKRTAETDSVRGVPHNLSVFQTLNTNLSTSKHSSKHNQTQAQTQPNTGQDERPVVFESQTKRNQAQAKHKQTQTTHNRTQTKHNQTQAKHNQTQTKHNQTQTKHNQTQT